MTTIEILNLKCGGCANTIKKGLLSVDGVSDISIDIETSKVNIDSENDVVLQAVKEKLSKMGYPEAGDANTIMHKAKSFVSCATGRIGVKA
ncbi:heavy-metal-associated domain-containing protein [Aureibaculum algae]|uniref:Heavy-metal-associated domain-containing protein n=1 Tax=Aureibaculum algae TaxID=2584122 RepID=A0A5B7TNS2_9FLAO|nr:heavy metal-associated domain-containing protein [Aureibaculum algae]QCX37041.1 heavy-metal-associated domain-containing protein [Aureibaculum algae]